MGVGEELGYAGNTLTSVVLISKLFKFLLKLYKLKFENKNLKIVPEKIKTIIYFNKRTAKTEECFPFEVGTTATCNKIH